MSVCVLGSINLDRVVRVEHLPQPGQTLAGRSVATHLGGKGANQAITSARLGVATQLIGAVGRDADGRWLRAQLATPGLDLSLIRALQKTPTGQAYILVADSGENVIAVIGGANQALTPRHLPADALGAAKVALAQLETPTTVTAALFAAAAARAALTLLNAAPAIPEGRVLFEAADILVLNETELAAYAQGGAPLIGSEAIIAAARGLIRRAEQWVVITLGAEGALAVSAAETLTVAGRPMPVIDTTGAGDCFCGALAAELSLGVGLEAALTFANAAAGLSVGQAGAAASMPDRAAVERLLLAAGC